MALVRLSEVVVAAQGVCEMNPTVAEVIAVAASTDDC
jgi:hypothetical protein